MLLNITRNTEPHRTIQKPCNKFHRLFKSNDSTLIIYSNLLNLTKNANLITQRIILLKHIKIEIEVHFMQIFTEKH